MPPSDLERIFGALEGSGARYLVVGGVAVVLHGHPRFTADLDLALALALALDRANVDAALSALAGLGYQPRGPVPLWSSELPGTEIDLFVDDVLPFEAAWPRRLRADLGGLEVSVAGLSDLIAMKRRAGRPQDLEDVQQLEAIARELGDRGHE